MANERQLASEAFEGKKSWDVSDALSNRPEVLLEAALIWVTAK